MDSFSRPEYWSGLLFPSLGDLSDSGIEPTSPALQADSPGKWNKGVVLPEIKRQKLQLSLRAFLRTAASLTQRKSSSSCIILVSSCHKPQILASLLRALSSEESGLSGRLLIPAPSCTSYRILNKSRYLLKAQLPCL